MHLTTSPRVLASLPKWGTRQEAGADTCCMRDCIATMHTWRTAFDWLACHPKSIHTTSTRITAANGLGVGAPGRPALWWRPSWHLHLARHRQLLQSPGEHCAAPCEALPSKTNRKDENDHLHAWHTRTIEFRHARYDPRTRLDVKQLLDVCNCGEQAPNIT